MRHLFGWGVGREMTSWVVAAAAAAAVVALCFRDRWWRKRCLVLAAACGDRGSRRLPFRGRGPDMDRLRLKWGSLANGWRRGSGSSVVGSKDRPSCAEGTGYSVDEPICLQKIR